MTANFYDVLAERGLVAQATEMTMRARLETPLTAYIGFDPTADSLHVGSLVPIMALRRLQQCGHKPLVVVGGATALIGDPSGKSEARRMLTREQVQANAQAIAAQIGRLVHFGSGATDAELLDNADWLAELTWIDLLRQAGPHFSVNRMVTMESVRGRMEGAGISFLEFNYMVMQAWDFAHLYRAKKCTLQLGGSDQWGNIVMGMELARRQDGSDLAGLTMPLVTKHDGTKFGKSEAGNVWLAAERTSVFEFYQFWRNTADADVARFLGFFTDLAIDEITALTAAGGASLNAAKVRLAQEVTALVHGAAAAATAAASAQAAFPTSSANADVTGDAIPHGELAGQELSTGISVIDLLLRAQLCTSKGEARRLIEGGGVSVDDVKIGDITALVSPAPAATYVLMRAGKKRLFRFDLR